MPVPQAEGIYHCININNTSSFPFAARGYFYWCSNIYYSTVDKPVCDVCVASKQCRKQTGDVLNILKSKLLLDSYYEVR